MKCLIVFMLLLTLAGCRKEETQPDLPPETTTGANTAGFIVNGKKVILPKDAYSSIPGGGESKGLQYRVGYNFDSLQGDYLEIRFSNQGDTEVFSIYARIHKMERFPKKYILGGNNGEIGIDGPNYPQIIVIHGGRNKETQWYYSKDNSGFIDITNADFEQQIFSGTFEATLYNRFDETKTIQISEGRFDINLITLNK